MTDPKPKPDGCWIPYYLSDPPSVTWGHRECLLSGETAEEPRDPDSPPKPGTYTCVRCGRVVM